MASLFSEPELGGYDYKFVSDPPHHLICLICFSVAKDPQQIDCCGKIHCKECLTEHKKHSNKCPHCRKTGNSFNDKRASRDIQALKVNCVNLNNGCQWVGELRSVEEHAEKKCDYSLLPCTKNCKINNEVVKVFRKDLDDHHRNQCPNRNFACPKGQCQEIGVYIDITTKHLETCPYVVIECPNKGCKQTTLRKYMNVHCCAFKKLPCTYAEVGCKQRHVLKDLKKHEEDDHYHLQITTERVVNLMRETEDNREDILELCEQVHQLKQENKELKNTLKFRFELPSFRKLKNDQKIFGSPPFYARSGYQFVISVDANGDGTHVSVFAHLMKGDNDDSLTWPFTGTVTVELLNQLEDKNHYERRITFPANSKVSKRVVEGERGVDYGFPTFILHSALDQNIIVNRQYLMDNSLFFRISVDTPNHKPWLDCTNFDFLRMCANY